MSKPVANQAQRKLNDLRAKTGAAMILLPQTLTRFLSTV